jgi:hypothetical protein
MEAAELPRSPLIAAVGAADGRELDHPATLGRLHQAWLRRIFVQR